MRDLAHDLTGVGEHCGMVSGVYTRSIRDPEMSVLVEKGQHLVRLEASESRGPQTCELPDMFVRWILKKSQRT